jgi:hypothetical protein
LESSILTWSCPGWVILTFQMYNGWEDEEQSLG